MANHCAERIQPSHRPSRARVRAAVARVSRHYARASEVLPDVFGAGAACDALRARVATLTSSQDVDVVPAAERVHSLAAWLAAVCETIELESGSAADLGADLAAIISECERIAASAPIVMSKAA